MMLLKKLLLVVGDYRASLPKVMEDSEDTMSVELWNLTFPNHIWF